MFSLRPVRDEDLPLILEWRNSPSVREKMFTTHVITPEEHDAHFARIQDDPTRRYLLCLDEQGLPVGVVTFTDIDQATGSCEWGFYLGGTTGRGTGTKMLYGAVEYAFGELGMRTIGAAVLGTNEASIRIHLRLGFQLEDAELKRARLPIASTPVHHFSLTEQDWTSTWRARVGELVRRQDEGGARG